MTRDTEHIISTVLELPIREQIVLMQRILDNISEFEESVKSQLRVKSEPKAKAESWETPAFYAEMDRRVASIKDGTAELIPAKEAIEQLRAAL